MDFNNLTKHDIKLLNKMFFKYEKSIPKGFDIILVLGGNKLNRAETGVEVYFKTNKPIMFSGGFKKNNISEAKRYQNYALKKGVKKADIIIEEKSLNTYENFLNSFDIIAKIIKKKEIKVLLVSSSIHLPRSLYYGNKIIKEKKLPIKLYPYPSNQEYDDTNWFESSSVRAFAKEELDKLIEQKYIKF